MRTTVPLRVIPVSVEDRKGHPISGLQPSDFVLFDNGQPRPATVDVSDVSAAPVAMVVLVQTNDFAHSALGKIRKVGSMIPEAVTGANSRAAVVTFDEQVAVRQELTDDPDSVADAFRTLESTDGADAKLLDATVVALNLLQNHPAGERQSILILGQSRDRGSKAKLDDVLDRLSHSGVTVYGMTYSAFLTAFTTQASEYQPAANGGYLEGLKQAGRLGKANTIDALTKGSGGFATSFETKGKLENNLISLGKDVHSRYLLAFTPASETASTFHKLTIQVRNQDNGKVRAQPGYWSISTTAPQ